MSRWRQNAMRSGLVVIGTVAFGYLSIQLIFKPYLEQANEIPHISEPATRQPDNLIKEDDSQYYKEDKVLD